MRKNDAIKILNPIDTVHSNPRMYWGVDKPTINEINAAILEQYKAENCKSIVFEEVSGWQVISTDTNWLKNLTDSQENLQKIFLDAKYFPGGGEWAEI